MSRKRILESRENISQSQPQPQKSAEPEDQLQDNESELRQRVAELEESEMERKTARTDRIGCLVVLVAIFFGGAAFAHYIGEKPWEEGFLWSGAVAIGLAVLVACLTVVGSMLRTGDDMLGRLEYRFEKIDPDNRPKVAGAVAIGIVALIILASVLGKCG